jgi:hypothetical protein
MNTPTMNKLQLCGAGSSTLAPTRRLPAIDLRKAAAVVLGAVVFAIAAAVWLVASRAAPLQAVDLPRVVIQAERLAPGSCPVPVDKVGADCPVPIQAVSSDAAAD